MSETYLPVKESLGYKNVKTALWNVFTVDLDEIDIEEGWDYENFGFTLMYKNCPIRMILSSTGKNIQFEFGEGGIFTILLPAREKNSLGWTKSLLEDFISDEKIKEKIRHIFGKNEKDVEYAMQVLKDYLDSDEAKGLLNNE